MQFKEGDGHHKLNALYELVENRNKYQKYIDQYEKEKGRTWMLPKFVQVGSFGIVCFARAASVSNALVPCSDCSLRRKRCSY